MDGYRDIINNATKNYARHDEYAKADRAFVKNMAPSKIIGTDINKVSKLGTTRGSAKAVLTHRFRQVWQREALLR